MLRARRANDAGTLSESEPFPGPADVPARRGETGALAPKQLTVGENISLSGEIIACDFLMVHGSVRVTLRDTCCIEIAEMGRFTEDHAEVEEAEIGGVYGGELTVQGQLLICSTGRVSGTVRYGSLQVERSGRLTGSVSLLEDGPQKPPGEGH